MCQTKDSHRIGLTANAKVMVTEDFFQKKEGILNSRGNSISRKTRKKGTKGTDVSNANYFEKLSISKAMSHQQTSGLFFSYRGYDLRVLIGLSVRGISTTIWCAVMCNPAKGCFITVCHQTISGQHAGFNEVQSFAIIVSGQMHTRTHTHTHTHCDAWLWTI